MGAVIKEAQSLSVKRASVEFHSFASLGEPERAMRVYGEENRRRGGILRKHLEFLGPVTPFLEIGANAGHTSYLLCNEFDGEGFALDLSADALRHGIALQDAWGLARAPVRIAGDALNLPFADNSLRMVLACQMLSQFMDIEAVFVEVKRVLQPGGVFVFLEEPIRRMLSLRLYRCPYYETMKWWERKLYDWGLLGYVVKDVIGAHQEESFGIRQNHRMGLKEWNGLVAKHFAAHEYEIFVPRRGWGERWTNAVAVKLDRYGSQWRSARLLGGTLAALCRKEGAARASEPMGDRFERYLRCPDCRGALSRDEREALRCAACGYEAANEGGVYNVLRSADRKELYPGDQEDMIDFSQPNHERRLVEGWYELEGNYGNKYRWIGERATARLASVNAGRRLLRVRGFAHERLFAGSSAPRVEVAVNGAQAGAWNLERPGLFVLEAEVPESTQYLVEFRAAPVFTLPPDERRFTVNLSMIRLVSL